MNARDHAPLDAQACYTQLLAALREPACYPHRVRHIQVIETHISGVILTGDYAYKIKKPVNLGFLDFTTLAARRHYCEEEVRLNRRYAHELYLGVVAIAGSPERPRIGGADQPFEYAVQMREFPQEALLEYVLRHGAAAPELLAALALKIAQFHAEAPSASSLPDVNAAVVGLSPALDNFTEMRKLMRRRADAALLDVLRDWLLRQQEAMAEHYARRLNNGRVRECHGDLHMGNIVVIDGVAMPFDCIEFDARLRWIDVMSEVAFLTMDLQAHGFPDLAYRFLNAYLEETGDYDGVSVLRFYLAYRALVRAKVGLILAQSLVAPVQVKRLASQDYLWLARSYMEAGQGAIIITHGLSGSGKTTAAQAVLEGIGAVRVRSDVERRRLHGYGVRASSNSATGAGIYGAQASQRTYERLAEHARTIAAAGFACIVDAAFLRLGERTRFRALAEELGVPFMILSCNANDAVLRGRIAARAASKNDASEATVAVMEQQAVSQEPLTADELRFAIVVDTGGTPRMQELVQALKQRINH